MIKFQISSNWLQTSRARQICATISCYISAIFASICFSWLSPYSLKLTSGENKLFTKSQMAFLISVMEFGSIAACIPAGIMADRYGRKRVLLYCGILAAAVWLITTFTKHIVVLYIARLIQGGCLASVEIVAPVYIAEISGANRRGTLGGYYAVFWYFGTLVAFIISDFLSFEIYTLSLISFPLLFFITLTFIPETPYYYLMKNKAVDAKESLQWLRYGEDIEEEYKEMEKAVREDMKNAGSWKDLVATKKDRRALFIALIACLARYLVGMGTVSAFAEDIFAEAGQFWFTANQQSICLALVFTLSTSVASHFSDTVGRRKLLIYSLIGTAISNATVAVYFGLLQLTSLKVIPYVWIMYVGIFGFCFFTSIGLGQLVPTIKAEFFPSHTRSKGGAFLNLMAATAVFAQMYTFPIITAEIGMYFNFLLFGIVAVIGCIFVTIYIPESAGKTLTEVNQTVKAITSR
ncbi:facilitated trehalose transporter Tret1-like [Rhodnius prolixus]|uniref:facilitated trehalose transporter Tret1-like n=1 Tax=Rhodnius prolixus TaxID=13249 RepID=UPI003D18AC36